MKSKVNICVITFMIVSIEIKNPPIETKNTVIFSRTELDYDNGIQKYEVEFYYNNREYSYEINANTGDILGYEQD